MRWPALLAWRDFRHHPQRLLATLLAVIVSVGFLAATQIYSSTETNALTMRESLYTSRADVIVQSYLWHSSNAHLVRDNGLKIAGDALAKNPDVVAVEPFSQLLAKLSCGDRLTTTMLTTSPEQEVLRWFAPSEGRLPGGDHEVVLTRQTADQLGAHVGDEISVNISTIGKVRVVGITDERGYADPPTYVAQSLLQLADQSFPPPRYGLVIDPKTTARTTPGASGDGVGVYLLVKTRAPSDADAVRDATQAALTRAGIMKIYTKPQTSRQVREAVAADVGARPDLLGWIIAGSALVALLIGALIISTTFSILVTQRRREVGLLRALGASGRQVWQRFVVEALLLGLTGAVLGLALGWAVALGVTTWLTHSSQFGLVVSWPVLAGVGGLGFVATLVAALLPAAEATRVRPLEALSAASGGSGRRRCWLAWLLALLALAGVAALVAGSTLRHSRVPSFALVAPGSLLLVAAALLSAPIWAAVVLRGVARRWPARMPTGRLALVNAARSPGRLGSTMAALILAMTLITSILTAAATGRAGAFAALDQQYPADVAFQSADARVELPQKVSPAQSGRDVSGDMVGFAPDALERVRSVTGVQEAQEFNTSEPVILEPGTINNQWVPLASLPPESARLLRRPVTIGPGQIGLSRALMHKLDTHPGAEITAWSLVDRLATLTVVEDDLSDLLAVVAPETITQLRVRHRPGLIIVKLRDPDDGASAIGAMESRLIPENPGLTLSGSAEQKANLKALLDGITMLVMALLGIAAVVALVGVGNTLGLSVLERARESALLRTLGLPRRGLWHMLLYEAWALVSLSVVAGIALGLATGFCAALAILRQLGLPYAGFHTSTISLAGAALGVMAAAVAASLIPGRRAAQATPIAALGAAD